MGLFISRKLPPAEKRARQYLAAAYVGLAGIILLVLARILDWPDFFQGLPVGLLLVSLVLLLRWKRQDEYYQRLWQAGASAAFVAVVILTIFGPLLLGFGQGLIDGFNDTANAAPPDFDGKYVGIGAILAFYAGFHVASLRSAR